MSSDVERLLQLISEGNPLQAQYIDKMKSEVMERREFEILEFLIQFFCKHGISLEQQAAAYLNLVQNTMEEQLYFRQNHRYRACDYSQVCQSVYMNNPYMSDYMIGLALSDCIWSNHIYILRWYEKELIDVCADKAANYMEVGCGSGLNLFRAMKVTNAARYWSIDLSETSVELCKNLLCYAEECGKLQKKDWKVTCGNFLDKNSGGGVKADVFTMFEVLEHVLNPGEMLDCIQRVTTDNAHIFVSTVINSPMPDHIYLFRSIQEVLDIVESHGFIVESKICAAANNMDLKKAEKKEQPITIALRLKKHVAE